MKNVLIAEDDQSILDALITGLERAGFSVTSAINGSDAIDVLKKAQPDILLLDLLMPGTPGVAVLEYIQKEKMKFPVIVISNLSTESDTARIMELGAKEFLIKSDLSLHALIEKIKGYL